MSVGLVAAACSSSGPTAADDVPTPVPTVEPTPVPTVEPTPVPSGEPTPVVDEQPRCDVDLVDERAYPQPLYDSAFVPRAAAHEQAGVAAGASVGTEPVGLIVGLSNTNSVAERFIADHARIPFVNAAFGGVDAVAWAAGDRWGRVHVEVEEAGFDTDDIAVVWMMHSLRGTGAARIELFCTSLQAILDQLVLEFPSVRQVYLSDRGYGGWSTRVADDGTPLNGEPGVWAQGIGIDLVVAGNTERADGVWVGWGPYAWANGDVPRADGVSWPLTYFRPDGVHWSTDGRAAYAQLLHEFFAGDVTAAWYRAG